MLTNYLATQTDRHFRANPWHGFGLLDSLGKLTEKQWHRPLGHRTVAGLVGHLIAWRNFAIARLDDREDFSIELHSASDWPDCSRLKSKELLQQLEDSQTAFLARLEKLPEAELHVHFPAGYAYSKGDLALGVMQHDIYHTGQINLLISLLNDQR